jgi:phosphoribosyl-ATP pyrophosphohydrolase
LLLIQRRVNGELEKIYSRRQSKIDKKVLTELAEKNYAKMAADLIRNAFAEMSDERGDIAFHIILTLRTLKRVAFLRVIKKDYPSRDEYYRLLLNFPLIAEELRFIQNPSVENIPNPRHVEPLIELNEI